MKIHIVQKGDTLWKLAKQYNVDFEALKAANTHLANPDMIMPGMKIRIPTAKKQVAQPKMGTAPKEKVMTPFKHVPQKAQPVIKEDDKKPKQKVEKKIPLPKLPPVSIQMPKLPNIYANQYNIDVDFDIDDHDTTIKAEQTTHHHHPVQPQPVEQEPIKEQPVEQPVEQPAYWPQPNMMWIPCLPCQMMPCPPKPCFPNGMNLCDVYQDPNMLYANYAYQNAQWQAAQANQMYGNNPNTQWGELDVNDHDDDDNDNNNNDFDMNNNYYNMQYPTQWPMQQMGYQQNPYYYPGNGYQGYVNYATYAPRTNPYGDNEEE